MGRLLTPTKYNLNFRGLSNGLSFDVNGSWKKTQFFDLPTDKYVVTGISFPQSYGTDGFGWCSDTCFIKFNDTVEITKNTTNIILKAKYDCYLLLFDNNLKTADMWFGTSPQRHYFLKKTENLYHTFIYSLHPDYSRISILNNDMSSSSLNLLSYSWVGGTYYYFNFINGEYILPEMVSN